MEESLRTAIFASLEQNVPVKDICFSGNGEPSLSPAFPEALKKAGMIRDELVPSAELVLITNGAGLLEQGLFSLLQNAADLLPLDIWLKLDAGTREWYKKINNAEIPFEKLISKIREFISRAPVTIQTMLCAVDGAGPPREEEQAWEKLMLELAANAAGIRKVQIYGKARAASRDPQAAPLPVEYLEKRTASLRGALGNMSIPVEVYP